MNFRTNALIAFLAGIGGAVIGVIAFILFSQLLGVSDYGVYLLFSGLVIILSAAADLGIDNSVQKQVSRSGSLANHAESYTAGFLVKATLVAGIAGLIVVFRTELNAYLGVELALNLIPAFIIRQFAVFQLKMLHGELHVGLAKVIRALQRILFVLLGVLLVTEGFGIISLTWSLIASWLIASGITLYYLKLPIERPNIHHFQILFEFSKYDSISSILGGTLYSWMDTITIGYFLSPTFVTLYEGAWRIAGGIMLLSQAIGTTIFPYISNWEEDGDLTRIEETFSTATTWSLLLVFPSIVGSVLIGGDLMTILTGTQMPIAHLALFLILLGKLPEGVNDVVSKVLMGLNRPDLLAKSMVLFALVNISLNIVLTPTFGIAGAATATAIAFTIGFLLNYNYLCNLINADLKLGVLSTFAVASIIMGIPVAILESFFTLPPLAIVGITVPVGVLSYGISLVSFSSTRELILRSPVSRMKFVKDIGGISQNED